jgi:hypothetical protein
VNQEPVVHINNDSFINANGLANYVAKSVAAHAANAQQPDSAARQSR